MIVAKTFIDKKVAIVGLGQSGLVTAHALIAGNAQVFCWDDDENIRKKAELAGLKICNLKTANWAEFDYLVLSPAIALNYPEPHWSVIKAKQANVPVIGDVEIFIREWKNFLIENNLSYHDCPLITISGTNGKSTTTALLEYLLKNINYKTQIGGNIGIAILSLEPFEKDKYYIIELSSYQIDLSPSLYSTIALLLNITPDHIDRHKNFYNYSRIKRRLVENSNIALLNVDDENIRKIKLTNAYKVSIKDKKTYYRIENNNFIAGDEILTNLGKLDNLPGEHNLQNLAMALAAIAYITNNKIKDIKDIINNFNALPHRLEQVRKYKNIIFVNDSKATNAQATKQALLAFNNIHWIVGGVAKEGGIKELLPILQNVTHAYLIGEAAQEFAQDLVGQVKYDICHNMETAVVKSFQNAISQTSNKQNIILLSPACASFDQFDNYLQRGDKFKQLVQQII
ncbi:UDP-N-acetylmuramoyl-L-alanine--D-glutamate ligase [Bartonella sp. DGB1]|uniref:UDP-N-acetylmuramoyl-L-alanine--D-glutamate ligase n=1 Tax=Bartonella sp. DGB1 TaxID=3239807 RepID=UPI003523E336